MVIVEDNQMKPKAEKTKKNSRLKEYISSKVMNNLKTGFQQ